MTTFAEMKADLEITKRELEKLRTDRNEEAEILTGLRGLVAEKIERVQYLEATLTSRNYEIDQLRNELLKSIFIARTPVGESAEDTYSFAVDAVAWMMGQKRSQPTPQRPMYPPDIERPTESKKPRSKRKGVDPFT